MSLFGQDSVPGSEANEGEQKDPSIQSTTLDNIAGIADEVSTLPEGFDPSVHAVNPDGTPKLRGDGTFAKKRGRKPGQKVAAGLIVQTDKTSSLITNEEAAKQTFFLFAGVAAGFVGPEWAPEDKAEENGMVGALKNYYDAKGQLNLPPEAGLVLAFGAYGARRMKHPNTRQKLFGFARRAYRWGVIAWAKLRG